jgi:hypothetical protein
VDPLHSDHIVNRADLDAALAELRIAVERYKLRWQARQTAERTMLAPQLLPPNVGPGSARRQSDPAVTHRVAGAPASPGGSRRIRFQAGRKAEASGRVRDKEKRRVSGWWRWVDPIRSIVEKLLGRD